MLKLGFAFEVHVGIYFPFLYPDFGLSPDVIHSCNGPHVLYYPLIEPFFIYGPSLGPLSSKINLTLSIFQFEYDNICLL